MSDEQVQTEQKPSTDPLIGKVIADRFRVQELIARGSMGKVYRALQMPLERPVAIKVLDVRNEKVSGEGFSSRFMREASVLARLHHANTVRVYDYGVWEGHSFLVMELIEGQPLSALIAQGAIPASRALAIGAQICASLREAHQQDIIHRDLKPSNILLTQQGDERDFVKVIDFGLGKEMGQDHAAELTVAGQILGSPMYMAPEQIRARSIDLRADVYSLGVVLYRALTGHRPFPQRGTPALMYAHLNEPPRAFSAVTAGLVLPPCVEWTVMRCLEKEPAHRFADAGQLLRALRACLIALESPEHRNITLDLHNGVVILPPELSDINGDSLVLSVRRPAAPSAAAADPPEEASSTFIAEGAGYMALGAVSLAVVLLMVVIIGGGAYMFFSSRPTTGESASPVIPPPARADIAPTPEPAPPTEPAADPAAATEPSPVAEPALEPAPEPETDAARTTAPSPPPARPASTPAGSGAPEASGEKSGCIGCIARS